MNESFEDFFCRFSQIGLEKPLIHHVTNFVTMKDCADITAASGASPVMAFWKEEVEDIVSTAKALVLNMGTPDENRFLAAKRAGKKANLKNIPVVLDPVGAGASQFRMENLKKLLEEISVSVLKGNSSEIKALAGISFNKSLGVDSGDVFDHSLLEAAKLLAVRQKCVVAVTGKTDYITDGEKELFMNRGSRYLGLISGSGCMTTSLIGCFLGVEKDTFQACRFGILAMSLAGEIAEKSLEKYDGAGMFKIRLLDAISLLQNDEVDHQMKGESFFE